MNEADLIKKTLEGETGAFDLLINEHRQMIYKHCLSIVKDDEIAEDLTQDAFLQAYQHLDSFRKEARFSTWVWRIAHNLSLNYLKKHSLIEQEFNEELLPPKFLKTEKMDEELIQKVYEAMLVLSEKHRAVFEMYDLKHIPQKQIAEELGISHGTVRSRLHYARAKIRQCLQEA